MSLLDAPDLAAHESDWIEATLTDPARPLDAMARLQARFPHAVSLVFEPLGGESRGGELVRLPAAGAERGGGPRPVRRSTFAGTAAEEPELELLGEALAAGRAVRLERQRH